MSKEAYKNYYQHIDGPIGGWERFGWLMDNFLGSFKRKNILEIGCGEGSLLKLLSRQNLVYGVDASESGVLKTRQKGIPCEHLDASNERLPYENNAFDVVITLETIEHVENPHKMLHEIKRVLKKDGMLLMSIPGEKVHHPFVYPGLFTKNNFSLFLEQSGFEIEVIEGWGQAPLLSAWSHGVREGNNSFLKKFERLVYFIGRKRNLLMRKYFGTPLDFCYCMNFFCVNQEKGLSRVDEVAYQTVPD